MSLSDLHPKGNKLDLTTSPDGDEEHKENISLALHAQVYSIAIKYGVYALRQLALHYFEQKLEEVRGSSQGEDEIANAIKFVFVETLHTGAPALSYRLGVELIRSDMKWLELPKIIAAIHSIDGLALKLLQWSRRRNAHTQPITCVCGCGHVETCNTCSRKVLCGTGCNLLAENSLSCPGCGSAIHSNDSATVSVSSGEGRPRGNSQTL